MKLFLDRPAAFRIETLDSGRQIALACDGRCRCVFCTGELSYAQKQEMLFEAQKALDEQNAKPAARKRVRNGTKILPIRRKAKK